MGVVGIGLGLGTAAAPDTEPAHAVGSYDVYYGEDVPDGMLHLGVFERVGFSSDTRTDGVIVVNDRRGIWRQPVSATDLQAHGMARFTLGAPGWSEEVVVLRRGWIVAGAGPVYGVWIGDGESYTPAFASEERNARAIIANHTVGMHLEDGSFEVRVTAEHRTASVPVPSQNESVPALGLDIVRTGDELVAVSGETIVSIATRETYGRSV